MSTSHLQTCKRLGTWMQTRYCVWGGPTWTPQLFSLQLNKSYLSYKLPKYRQFIKGLTREERTRDHCYISQGRISCLTGPLSSFNGPYHPLRQTLELHKLVVNNWSNKARGVHQPCLDCTDLECFQEKLGRNKSVSVKTALCH